MRGDVTPMCWGAKREGTYIFFEPMAKTPRLNECVCCVGGQGGTSRDMPNPTTTKCKRGQIQRPQINAHACVKEFHVHPPGREGETCIFFHKGHVEPHVGMQEGTNRCGGGLNLSGS